MTEITIGNRSYVILGQEFLSAIIGTRRDRFVLTALALLDGAKSSEPGKLGGGVIAIEAIIVNRPRRNCRYTALHLRPRASQIRRHLFKDIAVRAIQLSKPDQLSPYYTVSSRYTDTF